MSYPPASSTVSPTPAAGVTERPLSDHQTTVQTIAIGDTDYRIRSLLDLSQFDDADGAALARGISAQTWSHFGQVWPAGLVLATEMATMALGAARVLEVGCGLAIAGMVAHRRKADVTACDRHPLAAGFLRENLRLNGLPPLAFREVDWDDETTTLGTFDLIIGSDVLYEDTHPGTLVRFIDRHVGPTAEVMIVDPGRRRLARFTALMTELGFGYTERFAAMAPRTRIAQYRRPPVAGG